MRKYILFAVATLVMVGAVVTFRGRLIEGRQERPVRHTEQKVPIKERMGRVADEVIDKVIDSSQIVERIVDIEDVRTLVIEGTASVRLRRGTENSLVIRSPSFSKDTMKYEQKGSTLRLNGVSMPSFVGTLQSEYELTIDSLSEIKMHGTGNLDALEHFELESLKISNAGSGNVRMSADTEELSVTIAGSGNVTLEGITDELDAKILGSGNIRARALNGVEASVRILGSGDTDLGTFKEVSGSILGSGDITCVEGASLKISAMGSGSIKQVAKPEKPEAILPAQDGTPAEIPAP